MELDLSRTMESGQPPQFVWNCDERKARYWRTVNGEKLELWMEKGKLGFTEGFGDYVDEFLRAQDDYNIIRRKVCSDAGMRRAALHCRGLRLTKSGAWESLVCFVCSINNNLPRIRKMVQSLMAGGEVMPPEEMARADLCGKCLGYRDKYLKGCAERVLSYDLEKIARMDYGGAWKELQEFPGVGPKVADCVLLFGFGFTQAFPVDVWVLRAMKRLYGAKNERQAREIAAEKWGRYAGFAQQSLFCAEREGCRGCAQKPIRASTFVPHPKRT